MTVDIHNTLAEETTLHWHGLEVPGEVDGGPQGIIKAGDKRASAYPQPARSDLLVPPTSARKNGPSGGDGAVGLVLIEDDESRLLRLPKQWGIDDIPVIVPGQEILQTVRLIISWM